MGFEEVGGFAAQGDAEPGGPEVAERTGEDDDRNEFCQGCPGDAGADDEELERHGDRHERWNEDRYHPVAFEPLAEFCASARGGGFVHEAASAAVGGLEEDNVTNGGTRDGETRTKPRHGRAFDGDQYEQRVEYTGYGDAGGIEYGE